MRNRALYDAILSMTEKFDFNGDNTLFAHSVCPDEINHEAGDITDLLHQHFGEIFTLGGLAGIPFCGQTGFGAFAHHVPENGNIFVLFAPHCAISPEGKCGYYQREGQAGESTACGAAIGAWGAVKDLDAMPEGDMSKFDMQMDHIKKLVWKNRERIGAAENAIAETTYVLYEQVQAYMDQCVDRHFLKKHKIMLVGGIQINVEPNDYFEPKYAVLMEEHKTTDLLQDLLAFDKVSTPGETQT